MNASASAPPCCQERVLGCFVACALGLLFLLRPPMAQGSASDAFQEGKAAYETGDFSQAVKCFGQSARLEPGSGTLQNLGNAEWSTGRVGAAILAWEQSLWLDPFNKASEQNLRFARKTAQLEGPDLRWYEVISTWLPLNWWAWLTGLSLWIAVATAAVPGIMNRPKTTWQQAVAAVGLMVFLLTIPAQIGVYTRSKIGFVLQAATPLNLTPTFEAQTVTRLAAGQPARVERQRGNYLLIRAGTQGFRGWVEQNRFALICSR